MPVLIGSFIVDALHYPMPQAGQESGVGLAMPSVCVVGCLGVTSFFDLSWQEARSAADINASTIVVGFIAIFFK